MIHRSPFPDVDIPALALGDYVLAGAGQHAEAAALVDGITGEVTTYGQLADRVAAGAAVLTGLGVAPGDVVALMSHNQPAWPVGYHAALRAGAAVTPVNPLLTVAEIVHQLRASGTRMVLASAEAAGKASEAAGHAGGLPVLTLTPAAGLPCLADQGVAAAGVPVIDPSRALASLPYSSGTTGLPKGVMLTHRNVVANLAQHEPVYHVGPGDVALAVLPFFHIYGQTIIMNYWLRHGATIVTLPRFDLAGYLAAVARYRVTWLHLVPPTVLALTGEGAAGADLSSVRAAVSGAAPLDADVARRAERRLGCRIGQGYGMTEASPGTHFVPDDRPERCPPGTVGYLVPGTEARVVSPETGADTDGEGELWVRGPQVMAGYLGQPAATAAALVDGWLRTGDIVRVDGSGVWRVVDRLKELIKYKGYQVAPAELEAVLLAHPGVADAAVIGVPDPVVGESPRAYVVARGAVDAGELMDWVAGRVAPYKKLRSLELVDAIPRSPSGKVLRRVLREAAGPLDSHTV